MARQRGQGRLYAHGGARGGCLQRAPAGPLVHARNPLPCRRKFHFLNTILPVAMLAWLSFVIFVLPRKVGDSMPVFACMGRWRRQPCLQP